MPAPIGPEEVRRVADLARLSLSEDELSELSWQLGRILDYFEELSQVDVAEIAPLAHPLGFCAPGRLDAVASTPCDQATVRGNAPAWDGAYFVVPPVLGETSST